MKDCQVFFAKCDQGLQLTMSLMLKREGVDVVIVDDCIEAYCRYQTMRNQAVKHGVILIDLTGQRPLIERFVAAYQKSQGEIPLIVLTEYGDESGEGLILQKHGASMISKPFEPYILVREVKNKLSEENKKTNTLQTS